MHSIRTSLTVRENMSFGLRLAKKSKAEIEQRVGEASRILKLDHLLDRLPKQLSGVKKRQRYWRLVGPSCMPEGIPCLMSRCRIWMQNCGCRCGQISKLHEQLGNTMVYATGDQVEAMTMADKIVVLRDGRVEQVGAPLELYHNPQNQFVVGFIGSPRMNFLNAQVLRRLKEYRMVKTIWW